jgi:hypothetical protein
MKSTLVADIIYFIHLVITFFILFGIFILPSRYLPFYIGFIIFVILNWYGLFGVCILTKLEHYFRTGIWLNISADQEGGPEFFRPIVQSIFNIKLTRGEAWNANLMLFLVIIVIAFIKYIKSIKKH